MFKFCMTVFYLALKHLREKNATDIEIHRSFHLMPNADELKWSISVFFLNS